MIVEESEALARVNSAENLTKKLYEIRQLYPNHNGKKNIPPMVRDLIGVNATLSTQNAAAKAFGVSQPLAGYFERGEHKGSTVADKVKSVHESALEAMISCIAGVKDKVPDVKKATDLSMIAANMSRVVEKTTPKEKATTNVQVVVYSPRIHNESEYEEIVA